MATASQSLLLTSSNRPNVATNESSKTLCRYYMNGACRLGSRCQFSHDRNDRPSNVCRFYLRGACSYGSHCRYDHIRPSNNRAQETPKPPEQSTPISSSSARAPIVPETSVWDSSGAGEDELGLVSLKDMAAIQNSKLRADAKEFVPSGFVANNDSSPPSYAHAVSGGSAPVFDYSAASPDVLCPYFIMGECLQGDACPYMHGVVCDMCNRAILHPNDPAQNAEHRQECMAHHEREMELAFAVAKSEGKQCGICMEIVLEKADLTSRRFGILPSCKHCFCLDCIRKWRRAEQFENKVVRACPECRTKSDFVIPSTVWVEDDDEKTALLDTYQSSMKQKTCKYFKDGQIECPFGNKCFYRHVKPDGTVVQGDSPRTIRRRQQRYGRARNGEGSSADLFVLWDFLESDDWFRRAHDWLSDDDEDDDMLFEMTIERALRGLNISGDSDSDSFD